MEAARSRAWRFYHPDLDPGAAAAGLAVSPQGKIEMVAEAAAVRQAILLLVSTSPGERVMRPEYGCELRRLVFAPNDETTAGLAIHYVRQAVDRWEPRARIVRLDARQDPDSPDRLVIELDYVVRATLEPQRVAVSMSLSGEPI